MKDDDKGNMMLLDPIRRLSLIGCDKMAYNRGYKKNKSRFKRGVGKSEEKYLEE